MLFLDRPAGGDPPFGDVEASDSEVGSTQLGDLLDACARQCAVPDGIVAAASLDDPGRHAEYGADGLTLRWMLLHVLEEVARHVGHLDLLRERVDGAQGCYRGGRLVPTLTP